MKAVIVFAMLFLVTGCDQVLERAGVKSAEKLEAEGEAIGSACRHAGWGPEDCYRLNPNASKPAMFAGWKEMNEYMIKNSMETQMPVVPPQEKKKKKKKDEDEMADSGDTINSVGGKLHNMKPAH